MDTKKTTNKFSAEVRERAVRMVRDHQGDHASQWAAIASIASKIGCTAESLRRWLRRNFEAVEFATLEWVDWFNNKRLLEPIGNIPPAEAEARYYAQTAGHAMAA